MLQIPNATNDWTKSWFFHPHYTSEKLTTLFTGTLCHSISQRKLTQSCATRFHCIVQRSLIDWNSMPIVTQVDPYTLQGKSVPDPPKLGETTPPPTLTRSQFIFSFWRRSDTPHDLGLEILAMFQNIAPKLSKEKQRKKWPLCFEMYA